MLSTDTKSLRAFKKGPKENSSGTRTPSTRVKTRFPSMPRIAKPDKPNLLPVPDTETPGSYFTKSAISWINCRSMYSSSKTEIEPATSLIFRSVFVPITVTVSMYSSAPSVVADSANADGATAAIIAPKRTFAPFSSIFILNSLHQ